MAAGSRNTRMNFRPSMEGTRLDSKGTRPTRSAASVSEILLTMIIHVCKKSLLLNVNLKIAFYLCFIFLISLIGDFFPFPKTYFSRSDNIFNQYFVKIGWFWTLVLSVPFVAMTSYVNCCGRRPRIIKGHFTRLIIATLFWYLWTTLFNVVEIKFGRCNAKIHSTKQICLKNGFFWNGFDISGHVFILIYSTLILMEEGRAIVGWDSIKNHLMEEEYARSVQDKSVRINPLKNISDNELHILKINYEKFTPYIRMLFIAMTLLQLLWDVMLFCTVLYYHIMVEKFVSALIAIFTWFVTYKMWYVLPKYFPSLPGEGIFKYNKGKQSIPTISSSIKRKGSIVNGKHFMGMPIYSKTSESGEGSMEEDR